MTINVLFLQAVRSKKHVTWRTKLSSRRLTHPTAKGEKKDTSHEAGKKRKWEE